MSIWEAVIDRGRAVDFEPGDVLVHHGGTGDHCFAISSGEVLVTATTRAGDTVVIARRGPGDVMGELAALSGLPRTATVVARTEVQATRLTAEEYQELLRSEPDLAVASAMRLAHQLRELTERYAGRGEEVRTRVLAVLETNAQETGQIVFRSTREELAGWVGATREAVIRSLRDLETDGVVRLGRGTVELVGNGA